MRACHTEPKGKIFFLLGLLLLQPWGLCDTGAGGSPDARGGVALWFDKQNGHCDMVA